VRLARRAAALACLVLAAAAGATRGAAQAPPAGGAAPAVALTPADSAVRAAFPGLLNASCPVEGVATGGQLAPQHLEALRAAGYRSVLDLRAPGEDRGYDEKRLARAAKLRYVNIPVTARTLDDRTFDRVRAFMRDPRHAPVMVHCRTGNRVGVVLVPWLVLDRGLSRDEAVAAAVRMGLESKPLLDRALDYVARRSAAR